MKNILYIMRQTTCITSGMLITVYDVALTIVVTPLTVHHVIFPHPSWSGKCTKTEKA